MKIRMVESVRKWKLKYLKVWKNENSNIRKSGILQIYSFSILDSLLEIYCTLFEIYITNSFSVPFDRYQLDTFFKSSKKNVSSIYFVLHK